MLVFSDGSDGVSSGGGDKYLVMVVTDYSVMVVME